MKIFRLIIMALMIATTTSAFSQLYSEDYVILRGKSAAAHSNSSTHMVCGVMAGIHVPSLSERNGMIDIENRVGYAFGMMWGIDFGSIAFVPELWYSHNNSNLTIVNNGKQYSVATSSVEVPLLLSLALDRRGAIRFNLGPTFSLMNNSKASGEGEEDVELGRMSSVSGYLVGVSVDIMEGLFFDLRYTGRYVTTESQWFDGQENYCYRYYNFGVNVGYRF